MKKDDGMITQEEAWRRLDEVVGKLQRTGGAWEQEVCPTRCALGRVLAEDQRSRVDLPPFDKAAMDGYAIPGGEELQRYRVVAVIAAGEAPGLRSGEGEERTHPPGPPPLQGRGEYLTPRPPLPAGEGEPEGAVWSSCRAAPPQQPPPDGDKSLPLPGGRGETGPPDGGAERSPCPAAEGGGGRQRPMGGDAEEVWSLKPGTAVKVMTGAAVPPGTERVIMVEDTELQGEVVIIHRRRGGTNICRQGEDVRVGDVVARAGTCLGPLEVANLTSCGIEEVAVARRVRVAIISTGEEIVERVEELTPGKTMNTNGPLLAALCQQWGLEVVSEELYGDDPGALGAGVEAALERADVVILSGGVSAGDYDYVPQVLEERRCHIHFSRVAIKPGKPIVFATRGNRLVFGLPGNPVSVYITFHLFVLRAAAHLTGQAVPWPTKRLRLAGDFHRRSADRLEYVPVRLTERNEVEPVEFHGSAHLLALTQANGFMIVPRGVAELARGEEAQVVEAGGLTPLTPLP